jgi:DNA-binding HxlR family transcriptional regulator
LIVRDLLTGTRHFNALARGLPGMSRAILADRLRRLQETGIVEKHQVSGGRRTTEYRLTEAGDDIRPIIYALLAWGAKWSFGPPDPDELDPILLMWWMRNRVHTDRLPKARIVIEFNFHGAEEGCYWLLLTRRDVSVCLKHPGYEVDVTVTADLSSLFEVWLGRLSLDDAMSSQRLTIDALPALARDFRQWFAWSPAAEGVRAIHANGSSAPKMRSGAPQ